LDLPAVKRSTLIAQFQKIPLALDHTAAKIQFPINSTLVGWQSLVIRREGFFFAQNLRKMIQRIQTIFLFLVAVAMGVTIGTTLWTQDITDTGQTWSLSAFALSNVDSSNEVIQSTSKWYLASLAALIGLLAVISIFQYKNRAKQMMLNMINSLLMVGLVATIFFTTNGLNESLGMEVAGSYKAGFWAILVAMVMNMLANRFIRKDEALVRSVDRIR
jgi:glucan phosphoethanolaminetransferase (alkaline phosphatase superfamily)